MAETKAVRLALPAQLSTALTGAMLARRYTLVEALTEAAAQMDPVRRLIPAPCLPGPVRIEFPSVPAFLEREVRLQARRAGLLTSEAWARVVFDWCDAVTAERAA